MGQTIQIQRGAGSPTNNGPMRIILKTDHHQSALLFKSHKAMAYVYF